MLRHAVADRTWALVPVTVVHNTAEATLLRISAGSLYLAPHDDNGRLLRLGPDRWTPVPRLWTTHDVHYLLPRDRWFALGLLLRPGTPEPVGWYLNFQDAPVYRPWGIDTLDLELDMVAPADHRDRLRWKLKDAPRFRHLVTTGFLSKEQMRQTVAGVRELRAPDSLRDERAELLRSAGPHGPPADLATAAAFCGALPPDLTARDLPGAGCAPADVRSAQARPRAFWKRVTND
ncbi:DUF402 domain-containing protein [Streptomyces sp. NBC_00654]|uniref:DUF402 domain-containing protein n=1 Tax=Streptomyces sp. NBC_00654 TaxID=2975799 RepID=UPI002251FF8C|nr:DUF402 domain-containing protein [Streptomyces sp. NBC_00654]MCX4967039.1 DUF402 domain-containing protein [Streptomyces sp. NBC_00654]